MAVALIALFDECDATEKLSLIGEAFLDDNNIPMHDALRRSYEEYMKILDSLVVCFGNKNIEKSDFSQALHLAVSLAEIGVIPQTLDEVTFGSADRIRPSRPKVAFILGGVQGVFPKIVSNNGVFNLNERKYLIESGINVSDYSIYSAIDEEYLVYCNLCCASEKLYISYYNQNIAGEKCEPATFVNTLKNSMEYDILREPAPVLCEFCLPETENAAFSEFCRRITDDGKGAASIKDALSETSQKKRIDFLENCFGSAPKSISLDTALKLFGKNIKMSASRFDNFNRCRFSYFCRYGLKAQKLRAADFNAMQRGTLVHFVLERLITEHGDDLQSLTDVELGRLTDEYIGLYLDGITGLKTVMNAKTEFLISRISRSLKDVVRHVAAELKQSDFKPIACELKIGRDNPLSFPYDSGKIMLAGSIDRVDEYNGYIRVIDYKTGSKNFKLPDILFGLNMQMLIYLYAVTRAKGLDDSAAAGILYQPVKRNLNEDNLAMNGLLCADEKLYHAMDKGASGEFVPKLSLNKNGSLSQRGSTYVNKESFTEIFDHIERIMRKTGNAIASGDIAVSPIDGRESPACEYCDYKAVCGIENSEIDRVPDCKTAEVFEKIREGL